jgi:hypothetical protein
VNGKDLPTWLYRLVLLGVLSWGSHEVVATHDAVIRLEERVAGLEKIVTAEKRADWESRLAPSADLPQ